MPAALESGVTVSRYSIVGPIGAGGMGEVYKAQDAALERMVALKILPPDVVKNDERRRRFVQEARSASSLNHPHIVTIHEIGEATLASSGDMIHFIAMEFVDGSTLKRKIHDEQTDLRTLLTYLAQAADGLAKAHAAGIVHRDLKPENIMVTRDGFAKVLDFGLAKLSVRKAPGDQTDVTLAREATREGTVMGTVAYMSPEQVMGKAVDHRSDVFSFGAILYEAATRRRPFHADSDVDLMHKIMHEKPEPIDQIDTRIPAEVRRMVRRCLAKDPERRYQSMKDLSIELREIVEEYEDLSSSAKSRGSSSQSSALGHEPMRRRPIWIAAALVALIAISAAGFLFVRGRRAAAAASVAANAAAKGLEIRRVTTSGNLDEASISPDGRYVAHVARDRAGRESLHVRQVATGSDVEVIAASETSFAGVAFSPDGNYLYYSQRGEVGGNYSYLYQVPTLGGAPRKLLYDVDTAPSFSPDGKKISFGRGVPQTDENHYLVANPDGSEPRVVGRLPRVGDYLLPAPHWSVDGTKIFAARLVEQGALATPVEIDVASGKYRDIGRTEWWWITSLVPTRDGRGLLIAAVRSDSGIAQVWFQPLPDGEPSRITNDFSEYRSLSLTADGKTLAAVNGENDGELYLADVDDVAGGVPLDRERSRTVRSVSSSADGTIAYQRHATADSNVALLGANAAQPRLVTSNGKSGSPSISADGKIIAYVSFDKPPHIWVTDPDGNGTRQVTSGEGEFSPALSPDGRMLLYRENFALWKRPLAGGQPVKVIDRVNSSFGYSRDAKYVYFTYWTSGANPRINVRVEPSSGGAPLLDIPLGRFSDPKWWPKGDGLTLIGGSRGAHNIFLQKLDGSERVQLTKFRSGVIDSYDWTPAGKLIYVRSEDRSDVVLMDGIATLLR